MSSKKPKLEAVRRPTPKDFATAEAFVGAKTSKPQKTKTLKLPHTIFLTPELRKRAGLYGLEHRKKLSDVVGVALEAFLKGEGF